jgi:hypothetical protein
MSTLSGGPNIVTDGLVMYLDAANSKSYVSGSTSWRDIAGSNNGTLVNGVAYSTAKGGNLVFDGSDDHVNCGLASFQPTQLTLCAWVSSNIANRDGAIIAKGNINESTEWGLAFGYSNPYYLVGRATTSVNQLVYPWSGSLLVGYHYICYTMINNTSASLYIDGVQVISTNTIGSIGLNTKNVLIGKWNNYGPFLGNVAQTSIYSRALTSQEILQNFNATKTRFGL